MSYSALHFLHTQPQEITQMQNPEKLETQLKPVVKCL
jgi:hypothetical protein